MDDEQGPWWTRPPEPDANDPSEPPAGEYPTHQRTAPIPGLNPAPTPAPAPAGSRAPVPDQDQDQDRTVVTPGPLGDETVVVPGPAGADPGAGSEVDPEAAPPPPPKPPRPVIRRVAVVPPERPARPTPRPDDRTERLPAVSDDIFATFSGPASGSGGPPVPDEPQVAPRERRRPRIDLPETRVLLLAGAAGLVALLIVIVALLSGRSKNDPAPTTAARSSAPAPSPGRAVSGLKEVGTDDATELLKKAGQSSGGSVVEAWTWKDKNGQNLVATTVAPAPGRHRTLRVIHVADLDGDPRTLRVMRDPGLPAGCKAAGTAGFTPKSLLVRNLDGDDVADVMVGWTSRCGGADSDSVIKLALITDGTKYIIRGDGVVGDAGSGTRTPAPASDKWPGAFYEAVTAQYDALYG